MAVGELLMPKDKDRASIFVSCPAANRSLNPRAKAVKVVRVMGVILTRVGNSQTKPDKQVCGELAALGSLVLRLVRPQESKLAQCQCQDMPICQGTYTPNGPKLT